MREIERSYRTGRGVSRLVAFAGWAVALFGVGVLGVAVAALLRAADPFAEAALAAALGAGAATVLIGVVGVAAAQHCRATFDIADMTREMLTLAQRRAVTPAVPLLARAAAQASDPSTGTSAPTQAGPIAESPTASATPSLPTFSAPPRLRPADPNLADGKVHPIFSARPPR